MYFIYLCVYFLYIPYRESLYPQGVGGMGAALFYKALPGWVGFARVGWLCWMGRLCWDRLPLLRWVGFAEMGWLC